MTKRTLLLTVSARHSHACRARPPWCRAKLTADAGSPRTSTPLTPPPPHPTHYHQTATVRNAGVVKLYEQKLKQLNPQVRQITYELPHLFNYIDSLGDICALV